MREMGRYDAKTDEGGFHGNVTFSGKEYEGATGPQFAPLEEYVEVGVPRYSQCLRSPSRPIRTPKYPGKNHPTISLSDFSIVFSSAERWVIHSRHSRARIWEPPETSGFRFRASFSEQSGKANRGSSVSLS